MAALPNGRYRRGALQFIVPSMVIRYGNIAAWCTRCGSPHFELVQPSGPLTAASEFACLRCGEKVAHDELTCRIGDEAVRQAAAACTALKAQHRYSRSRISLQSRLS
jgi:hypothetical protein